MLISLYPAHKLFGLYLVTLQPYLACYLYTDITVGVMVSTNIITEGIPLIVCANVVNDLVNATGTFQVSVTTQDITAEGKRMVLRDRQNKGDIIILHR